MSTIIDVAKMAGVSISTVSLAFNSPERVSELTRKNIFSAAKNLNYIPLKESRKAVIKKYKSESIVVICPKLVGSYFFEILRGISETINMNKKEMVLYIGDDAIEHHLLEIIRNHTCQGVILVYGPDIEERYLQAALEEDFPLVACCFNKVYKGIGSISVNNEEIGVRVAEHFIKQKFQKIGVVGAPLCDSYQRKDAFIRTMEKAGISVPEEWMLSCELAEDAAYRSMDKFLRGNREYPEAFFCLNDDSAIGAIDAIQSHGLKVPEDISIVGCDDLSRSRYYTPSLSTVSTPKIEMGMLAVNMLMRSISGIPSEQIVLNGKLILRESCL